MLQNPIIAPVTSGGALRRCVGGHAQDGTWGLCNHLPPPGAVLDLPDVGLYTENESISPALAMHILQLDKLVSDVIAAIVVCHSVMVPSTTPPSAWQATHLQKASLFSMLANAIADAITCVQRASGLICESALNRAIPICTKWLDCVEAFEQVMKDMVCKSSVLPLDKVRDNL